MKRNIKRLHYLVFLGFLLCFPILPQHIYIVGGVNLVNLLVLVFFLTIAASGQIVIADIRGHMLFFWTHQILIVVLSTVHAGLVKGTSYFLSYLVIPICIIGFLNTKERFFRAIDIMVTGSLILGICGIFEQITKINVFLYFSNGPAQLYQEIRYGMLRVMTTFGQPISYGLYHVFITALIHYRLNTDASIRQKRFLIVVYIVSILNIFLTVSRIPMIAFGLIQLMLYRQNAKGKFRNLVSVMMLICIALLFLDLFTGFTSPLFDDLGKSILGILTGRVSSAEQQGGIGNRWDLWFWVFESMNGSWIFGHGPAAKFAYKVHEWQIKTSIENQYLYTLYNFGIVGTVSLLLMYLSSLFYSHNRNKQYGLVLGERRFSFNRMMFILLGIYYLVEVGIQESDMSRMYMFMIAFTIAYNRIGKQLREEAL